MTEIEVLEWLLKAKKAGFDYFLADCPNTLCPVEKIYGVHNKLCFGENMSYMLKDLSNPRLPQIELDYMPAMDKMDGNKMVRSLVSQKEWFLNDDGYYVTTSDTDVYNSVLSKAERLGKWVVVD